MYSIQPALAAFTDGIESKVLQTADEERDARTIRGCGRAVRQSQVCRDQEPFGTENAGHSTRDGQVQLSDLYSREPQRVQCDLQQSCHQLDQEEPQCHKITQDDDAEIPE